MSKSTWRGVVFFGLLVGLWEGLSLAGIWSPVVLPSPADVVRFLVTAAYDGTLLKACAITCKRLAVGYLIGFAVGLPLGLVNGRRVWFRDTIGLLSLGMQTLPSVCWAPLALLWFGQTEASILFITVMGTLWSVLLATSAGVENVPPIYLRAAKTMGSRRFHTLFQVILPASLPFIVSGMKQGWAFAWRSLMAAEIYITLLSGFGLGQMLHYGRELHAMDSVIGVMFIIVVIGLGVDRLLFAPVEQFLHRRWGYRR